MDADQKKRQRRTQILRCARDAFAEKGYAATTVDDVVSRASVARGTFYLYFKDRRDVFETLIDEFLEQIDRGVRRIDVNAAESPFQQLRQNLLRATRLARRQPAMLKIVLLGATGIDKDIAEKLSAFWSAIRTLLESSLNDGQAMGLVRDGDKTLMARMGLGAIKEILLVSGTSRTAEEITDAILAFLANGLLTYPLASSALTKGPPQK